MKGPDRRTDQCARAPQAGTMTDSADDHSADLHARMHARCAGMSRSARHDASIAACHRLVSLDAFQGASVVLLYLPLADEVDTTPAAIRCFQSARTVCVPRVNWQRAEMTAVEATSFDDDFGQTDTHGLRHPHAGTLILPRLIDVAVIPGYAFDTHGHRAGRGGNCYRRFLSRLRPSAATVGLAFDAQITDEIPPHLRDVQLDVIVTERRVTRARRQRSPR